MEEVDRQFEELVAEGKEDAMTQYNGACMAAQLARVQGTADDAEVRRFKRRALELLRRAYTELGYDGHTGIDNDPDLAPLYNDPEFQDLLCELKPPVLKFDPIERTVFIKEFPVRCGDIEGLVGVLGETDNAHLRSGMCLAVGGLERPTAKVREAWGRVFRDWYRSAPDSGTHSAAGWALRSWGLSVPRERIETGEVKTKNWYVTKTGLTMIRIPAGQVKLSEGGEAIPIEEDFWLSDREVTVGLFRQFMDDREYAAKYLDEVPDGWGGEDSDISPGPGHPVQRVSWYDSVMFCNWLSRREGHEPCYRQAGKEKIETYDGETREFDAWQLIPGSNGYRLPTEDEWEYACRACTTTEFCFGNDSSFLLDYGWYWLNSDSRAHACGEKLCNAWGLFDMHGNVWEWCQDWYERGSFRVYRGGGWYGTAGFCLSSYRDWDHPTDRDDYLGFRVARGPFVSESVSKSVGEALEFL